MAVHPMLRRIGVVVAGATVAFGAGPLTGAAHAAPPTLAANGLAPASGAATKPVSQVSACYASALTVAPGDLVVRKGTDVVGGTAAAGSCNGGTNNRIVWTAVNNVALTEGAYGVTATARTAGAPTEVTTTTWAFTVDATNPVFTASATPLTSPITGPKLAANTVTFSGSASDVSLPISVAVTLTDKNNAKATETTTLTSSPSSFSLPLPSAANLADGQVSATAVVTDAAGNATTSGPFTALKDTAGPAITSSVPANGASVQPLTVVSAAFDETLDGPASTVVLRNKAGNPVAGTADVSGTAAKFTATAPLTETGSPYSAEYATRDLHGNTSTRTVAFTVDKTAPLAPEAVTVTNPVNAETIATATVAGTAEKGSAVTVTVDDASGTNTVTASGVADATSGAFTVALPAAGLGALAQGPLTVKVTARDAAGNTGAPAEAATTKDTIRPAVTGLQLAAATGDAVTLTGSTEKGLGVAAYLVDAAGTRLADVTTTAGDDGAFSMTLTKAGLTDPSTVTAYAVATDAAGNKTAPPATTKLHSKTGVPVIAPLPLNAANADEVVVSGTTLGNAHVDVLVDDADTADVKKVTAATVADADGKYATAGLLDLSGLADGPVTVTVTSHDGSGTVFERAVRTVVKDTVSPTAPAAVVVAPWVNTATLAVSGTAPAGSKVTVTVGDGVADHTKSATGTAGGDGAWSVSVPVTAMNDGDLSISAVATDAHDNASAPWTGTTKKDTAAPAAPATLVLSPDPVLTSNVDSVTVSGTGAEPSSKVTVTLDDADGAAPESLTETVTADAAGAFTAAFAEAGTLSDGVLTASAKVTDAAGNTGPALTDTAQMDTTELALVATTPADKAFVKNVPTVTASFNEPLNGSTTIVVTDSTKSPLAGTSALSADKLSVVFTPAAQLTEAGSVYTVTISARDALDNDTVDATRTFSVDRTAPDLSNAVVNGGLPIDAADAKSMPVSGTTEPGAQVTVSADDTTAGNPVTKVVTAGPDGAYAASLVLVDAERFLADGEVTVTISAVDAATNVATNKVVKTTMDSVAPPAPTFTLTDPVNKANVAKAVLAGDGEAGAVAGYVIQNTSTGPLLGGTTPIAADGTWTKTVDLTGIGDGAVRATVTVKDAIGNESAPFSVTVSKDVVAPDAPSVTLSDPVNKANQTGVTVSGTTAEPGQALVVTLTDGGTGSLSDSTVTSDVLTGEFSKSFDVTSLADGPITATVTATDAAGNVSQPRTATATKDSELPGVPVLTPPAEITHRTHTAAPFAGTADKGSTVVVKATDADGASVTGSATADDNGAWAKALDVSALKNGTLAVGVTVTDAAGNVSETAGSVAKNSTRAFTIAVGPAPVSGAAQAVTVTAHETYALDSAVDKTFTGTPELTSLDGHFTAGSCAAAVDGVATCTGTVFGDLGLQTLRAKHGSAPDLVEGASTVTVQPTGLAYSVAPPATATPDQAITFTVVPTAGVAGASIAGYSATRKLSSTGGTVPQHGSVLNCPTATCEVSVTFVTRGTKTISVVDNGTPALQAPVATVTIPYRTSIPLYRSHTTIPYGAQVLVIGELTNTSTLDAVPGKRIEIWRKVAPATTYSKWTTVTTDEDGIWYVIAKLTRNTTFQARFAGDGSHLASQSAAGLVRVAQVVSSTWSKSGRTVKAVGRVSPNAAGRTVYLQYRRADGSWAYAGAKAVVSSTGTYTVRKTYGAGRYVSRVYVPATAVNVAGVSRSYTIS